MLFYPLYLNKRQDIFLLYQLQVTDIQICAYTIIVLSW